MTITVDARENLNGNERFDGRYKRGTVVENIFTLMHQRTTRKSDRDKRPVYVSVR